MKHSTQAIIEEDLTWLYCQSHADTGIHSNFESFTNVMQFGISTIYHDPYNEHILHALSKKRKLEKILSKMDDKNNKILYYTYSEPKLNPYVSLVLGKYAGAAAVSEIIPTQEIVKLCQRSKTTKLSPQDDLTLNKIKYEAILNLRTALQLFSQLRNNK